MKDPKNGHNNQLTWTPDMASSLAKQFEEMQDLTVEGAKALYPGMFDGPLFSQSLDSSNPASVLIQTDGNLANMLKIMNLKDIREAQIYACAIMECYLFLYDKEGKPSQDVLLIIEGIKIELALRCSVGALFADLFKQASTGVVTNTYTEKGMIPIMPQAKSTPPSDQQDGTGTGNKDRKGRP